MRDRMLDPEKIRIEIAVADPIADLAGQTGVELILGHRLEQRAIGIRHRRGRIERHVHRLGGDRDLVNLFPRPLEVWAARGNDAELRIVVALFFLVGQWIGDRIVGRHGPFDPLRPSKRGLDGPFILVDRIDPGNQITDQKPGDKSDDDPDENWHVFSLVAGWM